MTCSHCGRSTLTASGRCTSCGAVLEWSVLFDGTTASGAPLLTAQTDEIRPLSGGAPDETRLSTMSSAGPRTDAAVEAIAVGHAFGSRYQIIRQLGIGGMGAVYQAWDQELSVVVALKVIRPEVAADPQAARMLERRFKQELLLARQVTHKNVVRIHDLGEINGVKYITMPYIDGEDLASILKREGKLPVRRVLQMARTMASGLAAAHAAGVVHRDLKPANIMIDADGEAMIMDFGVARSTGAYAGSGDAVPRGGMPSIAGGHTLAGMIVGTVEYMAPEQAKAQPVDHRADIYAFGLILYDLLAGRTRQTRAESALAELTSRTMAPPPAARSIDPAVPEPVDRIITRCVQPDAAARYQTTAELVADLDRLDEEGHPVPIVRRLTRRMVVGALTVFLAVLVTTWWLAHGPAVVVEPDPISVLIADFENKTGDSVFDGAVEQTLGLAMEGASFIDLYPRAAAQQRAVQLKAGSRLDEQMARVLSRSEGIRVVLAGSIAREGSGYTISVRAIDPAVEEKDGPGKPIAVATASAASKEQVLQTLGVIAARLRGPLGDTTPESARLAAAESFTTSSPEAVKSFTLAQELQFAGRKADAFQSFTRATEQDPQFGRAYASAGVLARELGREQEAQELWKKALSLMSRMTERERYRMLGSYYNEVQNYQKAVDTFSTLVKSYPADRVGRGNLALAYFWALDIPKALEESKRLLALDPKNPLARSNHALYAMYAGEFDTSVEESKKVLKQQPSFGVCYVPLAVAALARGDSKGAREAYSEMAKIGAGDASLASIGLADIELYEGRYAEAEAILKGSIASDQTNGNSPALAAKYIALAETYEGQGQNRNAVAAARTTARLSQGKPLQVLAAIVLIRSGQVTDAKAIAASFSQQLTPQSRAYGKILEGQIALKERRMADAVDAFTAAQKFADLWLARFNLGIAYIEAGAFAEGLGELDRCQKRRGEATAIFLDEVPSFRYLAPLPYWLARAQQELGMSEAATANYKTYVALRAGAPNDLLATDARKRLVSR